MYHVDLYSRPARSVANMLNSTFDLPHNDSTHRRKSVEEQSTSAFHQPFSSFSYDPIDGVFLESSLPKDDTCHFDEFERTHPRRSPTTLRHGDVWLEEYLYFSSYTDPHHYAQHGNGLVAPRGVFQNRNYTVDDLFVDELAHQHRLSLIHGQYVRDAGLSMNRSDYIPVTEDRLQQMSIPAVYMTGALHEDDIVLNQDPSLYETSKASRDCVHGVFTTLVEAITASVVGDLHAKYVHPRTISPEVERHPANHSQRTYPIPRQTRQSDIREHLRREAFHSEPQHPRSKYRQPSVNPRDIHLGNLKQERAGNPLSPPSLKAQLDKYNRWWKDLQSPQMINKPTLESIPFLSPSTSFNPQTIHTENHGPDWKWAAYQFFCLAFDLHPRSIPQSDFSILLTFTTPLHSTNQQTDANLQALRAQLKLEKVRWHEDKLRAHFGHEVARDDRVKGVWGAVMELKKGVDDVLEAGWMREGD